MRIVAFSARHLGEQRRYFPDWIDRLLDGGPELEADRNSYLAGGYAEEFGYRAQAGFSRGVPVLDEDSPESAREWHCQARATHPGYPLKAHPVVGDIEPAIRGRRARAAQRGIPDSYDRSVREPGSEERHGTFYAVSNRLYERERRRAAQKLAALSARLAAAVVSLRWTHGLRHWQARKILSTRD